MKPGRAGLWACWLILGLGLSVRAGNEGEPRPAHFYFVQITDTHWGARDGIGLTRQIVKTINELPMKIEFVVHTGDILSDNIDDAADVRKGMEAMARLKVPIQYVPGNHDVGPKAATNAAALYRSYFGPLSHQAEYHGVICLFIDSEPLSGGPIREGQARLKQLGDQMDKAEGKPILLFQHSPSVDDFHSNTMYPGWPPEFRRPWESLVQSHNVKAVIAGHFHRDELHWIGAVPIFVAPPVSRFWNRQPAFRIYEYRDGTVSYRTQYVEAPPPKGGVDGEPADRP